MSLCAFEFYVAAVYANRILVVKIKVLLSVLRIWATMYCRVALQTSAGSPRLYGQVWQPPDQ